MAIKSKTVYVAEDGKEFDTLEEAKTYENCKENGEKEYEVKLYISAEYRTTVMAHSQEEAHEIASNRWAVEDLTNFWEDDWSCWEVGE